ncbi:hypothetical protein FGO68_gene10324 [Halteria grandinella]|uniref:protein-tyrosine-phosphatase n=1 Tax=Halteria grandinella TaxID=5974 RepID=A0A8J8NJC8_HALGN|nr:hypothetical protein FGO68_gene10324 [Halteria grandinella]
MDSTIPAIFQDTQPLLPVEENEGAADINEICDHLYLGSKQAAYNRTALEVFEIKSVLVVGEELECKFIEDRTLCYKKLPIIDDEEFDITAYLNEGVEFVERAIAEKTNVLVHCRAGRSRSASFVIAYLMKSLNLSYEDAFKYAFSKRRCVMPNDGFIKHLKEFNKKQDQ